ncbi:UrcA family protein [Novosphingobium terrae]|uniref:UrcA family protein n=1 Tax=Novosphingobium terrae TaxID=2726189 RepID=UPI00197E8B79|nr:UrcA family protein [Novosphingobium terrae]
MTYRMSFFARCALFSGLMVAAASPVAAQDLNQDPDRAPRLEINLAGVDVTTPKGEALARRRISGAARSVCAGLPDPDGFNLQATACANTARQQGYQQLSDLRQTQLARRMQTGKTVDYALKTR